MVAGVVGPGGVGKTTFLERLIPALGSRGVAVGAVKHASHGFVADRRGKDSHRLYECGAAAVAVISRAQIATFVRRGPRPERPASLQDALAGLPPGLEVVLVEGFSSEPIPRVVLVRGSEAPPADHVAGGEVLRIVRVRVPPSGEKPVFADRLIASLAREIAARVLRSRPAGEDPRSRLIGPRVGGSER